MWWQREILGWAAGLEGLEFMAFLGEKEHVK